MLDATLIFPNQLFEDHPALKKGRDVILAEEFLFFRIQNFHKQKLVLMRAAMKFYANYLESNGFHVIYVESENLKERGSLFKYLHKMGYKNFHVAEVVDDWLETDIAESLNEEGSENFYKTPGFIFTKDEVSKYFESHSLSMASFYMHQRKKYFILMEKDGKPVGGRFSFDKENRKKVPKKLAIPPIYKVDTSAEVKNVIHYVNLNFPNAVGCVDEFFYATTFEQAKDSLRDFLVNRFTLFGDYEDAICKEESFLFHSVLSPLINLGLLTPRQVIIETLAHHKQSPIPLNSLEGFIRQIMGWREYVRSMYNLYGKDLRSHNRFGHTNPLPKGFYEAATGLEPVDSALKRIMKTGYCHHIERLMVLGNYLLLMETDPELVYTWFMECFVDAYDWVMVPNVYAMSQFSTFIEITTKPYISGSNYILKMSDYAKGPWVEIWDGLFWRFFEKNLEFFLTNPRMNMLQSYLKNNEEKLRPKIERANSWVKNHGSE